MGVLKKSGKWGCVFCKKVDLSSMQGALCTVSIFLLYILLIWGAYAPNTPMGLLSARFLKSFFQSSLGLSLVLKRST